MARCWLADDNNDLRQYIIECDSHEILISRPDTDEMDSLVFTLNEIQCLKCSGDIPMAKQYFFLKLI